MSGWGSAIIFDMSHSLIFEFCEIQSNTGVNCILFDPVPLGHIRCLGVRRNVCSGSDTIVGLFYTWTSFTIEDSVISGNTVNYFLAALDTTILTFLNCHFDTFAFSTTDRGVPATVDCFTDGAFLCQSWLITAGRLVLRSGRQTLRPDKASSPITDTKIALEAGGYVAVKVSVGRLSEQVLLVPKGSRVFQLTALVQAEYCPSRLCDLTPSTDGKPLNPKDPIRDGQKVAFALDTQPLTFEFANKSRITRDFSLDASFGFITASLGLSRGVLWDRLMIDSRGHSLVCDIQDLSGALFLVAGPTIDVVWEPANDKKKGGRMAGRPQFR
jgi:hypothetical protein